ncbi:MAG TPA: EfeM/EfeO family lipoprotein [Xanthobacteraceae bacterium]|nr:EfeM/EfeO family lipoprotein [Xanthobacteraceae bacterium]
MPKPIHVLAHAARVFVFTLAALLLANGAHAASLSDGLKNYKSYVIEHIGKALSGAKELQQAVKAKNVKAAQAAWIKSRKGWEAAEPITGEFFSALDEAIDAWPDSKKGYHAIEDALFAGKLGEISSSVDELVANLAKFNDELGKADFQFEPQGLMNGLTKLAYEVGENKSKGGESPYAGTSLIDMHENVEGIEALYQIVFEDVLQEKDAKLAGEIHEKIETVEKLVKVKDLKTLNQPALRKGGEELAVLLQNAAVKLGLKKPAVGE